MPQLEIRDDRRLSSRAIEATGTDELNGDVTESVFTGDRDFEINQLQVEKPLGCIMEAWLEHTVDGVVNLSRIFSSPADVVDAFYAENRHVSVEFGKGRVLVYTSGGADGPKKVTCVGVSIDA